MSEELQLLANVDLKLRPINLNTAVILLDTNGDPILATDDTNINTVDHPAGSGRGGLLPLPVLAARAWASLQLPALPALKIYKGVDDE